jgi:hypothetical protein
MHGEDRVTGADRAQFAWLEVLTERDQLEKIVLKAGSGHMFE